MIFPASRKIEYFAPGVFAELAGWRRAAEEAGRTVLDLSIGSPDVPPALDVREALSRAALGRTSYGYTLGDIPELRLTAAEWYAGRYGVELDPERELCSISGSQDALVHFFLAFTDPGDAVLVPDPCFPAVMTGLRLAGAEPVAMPLRAENGYLPDLAAIAPEDRARARVMVLSYPNNPTGAIAPDNFYRAVLDFARENRILLLHDNAYSELVYDGVPGRSILEFPGSKDVAVELNSLSKSCCMPGARMAFLLGNEGVVETFSRLKSNLDLGAFLPVQLAAIAALEALSETAQKNLLTFRSRRDAFCRALAEAGLPPEPCHGGLFVWVRLPGARDDRAFARALFDRTAVLCAPGSAFGREGRGFVRFSLMLPEKLLCAAAAAVGESRLLA